MGSNVYTKNEILQELASRGFFVDAYTLDTFFQKWKVEAIFEDEQGSEFFDKNALDLVLSNLFNTQEEKEKEPSNPPTEAPKPVVSQQNVQSGVAFQQNVEYIPNQQPVNSQLNINDQETVGILNNIELSDGTPLINKIQDNTNQQFVAFENVVTQTPINIQQNAMANNMPNPFFKKEKKIGILEGAMQATGQEFTPITSPSYNPSLDDTPSVNDVNSDNQENNDSDFDDISLLSESLEAQEKFREYVVSELSKKNVDLTPKQNEFKLDISERTLSMIARAMAKKIAKHIGQICSVDAKTGAQLSEIQEQNKKLEQRTKDLEDQNRKLRLLLAESNKNLNSYKPSFFGLYKKVSPKN